MSHFSKKRRHLQPNSTWAHPANIEMNGPFLEYKWLQLDSLSVKQNTGHREHFTPYNSKERTCCCRLGAFWEICSAFQIHLNLNFASAVWQSTGYLKRFTATSAKISQGQKSTILVHYFDKYSVVCKYLHTQTHSVYVYACVPYLWHHFFLIYSLFFIILPGTFLVCPFSFFTLTVCCLPNLKEFLRAFLSALKKKPYLQTLIPRSLIFVQI